MYFDNLNNLTPDMISHFADSVKKCLTYAKKNDLWGNSKTINK